MRELTGHKVNGCNSALEITVNDEPGIGGANHEYTIRHPGKTKPFVHALHLRFQDGPIAEVGTNGITHEALLAILIDRLEGFQRGPYACEYNQAALDHLRSAQTLLHNRTQERLSRGVEGTHQV